MTGKELKNIVKNSPKKAKELIELSGIPEQTFFSLYKKEEVEQHYIDKLVAAGLKLQKTTKENRSSGEMEALSSLEKSKDLMIKKLLEINTAFLENTKTLNRLVNENIDKGNITINNNHTKK